jgi:hypothetical protein
MNPYEESLLRSHQTDLARETRSLQLSGGSGAIPESETEVFWFGKVRPTPNRITRALVTMSSWLRDRIRAGRTVREPQAKVAGSPSALATSPGTVSPTPE